MSHPNELPLAELTRLLLESGTVSFRDDATRNEVSALLAKYADELREDAKVHAQQEATLAAMARFPEMNPGPVIRTNVKGDVLLANRAARDLFGSDFVGMNWCTMCPAVTRDFWKQVVSSADVLAVESRFGDKEFLLAHSYDAEARLVFVFGTDITKQKRAERALAQSERMATLGTLAAGVAHELNNPAAATRRAAEQLRDAFVRLDKAQQELSRLELTDEKRDVLTTLDTGARDHAPQRKRLSGMMRLDLEGDIEDWLDDHGLDDVPDLAPALLGQGLGPDTLDRIATTFPGDELAIVLEWAASVYPVHTLSYEIGQGATRIAEIVTALKSYSFLGQAPVQFINLHDGIDNTLVILRNKLKEGIDINREYDDAMPEIPAYGSELNQVWTNILDNAADAMGGKGTITIRTRADGKFAVVEIEDDGPGIPEAALPHVFDPFFTTKAPGKGTGLGLSTTYSIITEKHGGRIAVESKPGATRFTIHLPLQGAPATPASGPKA